MVFAATRRETHRQLRDGSMETGHVLRTLTKFWYETPMQMASPRPCTGVISLYESLPNLPPMASTIPGSSGPGGIQ